MDPRRREFLSATSLGLLGLTAEVAARQTAPADAIIDIHQHLNYSGRPDAVFLAHQRAMGATITILLPAGRPANTAATHQGKANGLQAQALGTDACATFARDHPGFVFGANDRPDATDAEMIEALERAQAIEFIARQTDGLDTVIGERGRSLSGGERQRLSIARALLKNPPILILDEATSALDAATERKLQMALDEVMKGRTTFVIAHRLATIRNANRILVFDQGRVIESGTFDELVANGGRFAELAKAQFMAPEEPPKRPVRVSAHA